MWIYTNSLAFVSSHAGGTSAAALDHVSLTGESLPSRDEAWLSEQWRQSHKSSTPRNVDKHSLSRSFIATPIHWGSTGNWELGDPFPAASLAHVLIYEFTTS